MTFTNTTANILKGDRMDTTNNKIRITEEGIRNLMTDPKIVNIFRQVRADREGAVERVRKQLRLEIVK